jgi:HNH endonuclease
LALLLSSNNFVLANPDYLVTAKYIIVHWKEIYESPHEYWTPIILDNNKEYLGYYISSKGRVYSDRSGKCLKPWRRGQKKGTYHVVEIRRFEKKRRIDIQRLVAIMYIPNTYKKREVNHIDGDHYNNDVYNLEWVTREENEAHKRILNPPQEWVDEAMKESTY